MKMPKQSTRVLRARAHIEFAPSAVLDAAADRMLAPLYDHRQPALLDLAIGPDTQSVTATDDGRPTTTIVYRPGRATSVWDHGLKAYLDAPAENTPRIPVLPVASQKTEVRSDGERTVVSLTLTDAGFGQVRYELVFSKDPKLAEFGRALFYVLHCGPGCHETSRLDVESLAAHGCIVEERAYVAGVKEPVMRLRLEDVRVDADTKRRAFVTPDGYAPMADVLERGCGTKEPEGAEQPGDVGTVTQALDADGVGTTRQALDIVEVLTPDCLGSTRFGAMAAVISQDLFDHATTLVNTAAPLLGTVTLAGGTLTVPWLGTLAAIRAASPTAPGSGLFCFLRDPRVPASGATPASGGTGLLDRLAVRALRATDGTGLTRLERESVDGTLVATLTTWGVNAATRAALVAAGGTLTSLTVTQQIAVTEGYERTELGTFTVTGLPTGAGPFTWLNLLRVGVTGVGGTVAFGTLGGAPLLTANIGATGNIAVGITLPTTTLTATVTRALTPEGWGVLASSLLACFLMPLACPAMTTTAGLLAFVLNNVTVATVTLTGLTVSLDVAYRWNNATSRVEPVVTTTGRTGVATIVNTWVTPNLIANVFDSFLLSIGNLFNAWPGLLATAVTSGLQGALIDQGLTFPAGARQFGLEAMSGRATSANRLLTLSADIKPLANVAALPYVTQVDTLASIRSQLETLQAVMDVDLNRQPVPPAPMRVVNVGTYFGLAISQNALNDYLFAQWRRGDFEREITDPLTLRHVLTVAPRGALARQPVRVHLWPAVAPRVELSMDGFAQNTRPLVVFFDDVRACFESVVTRGDTQATPVVWELSFSVSTTATATLSWPMVVQLLLDSGPAAVRPGDLRTWEFIDSNVPAVMETFPPAAWSPLVDLFGGVVTASPSAAGIVAPPSPAAWRRPLVSLQQELLPSITVAPLPNQSVYLDVLARFRTAYLMGAVQSTLLELVDGSGAPLLNLLTGHPTGTIGLGTMTCADGASLRSLLALSGQSDRLP